MMSKDMWLEFSDTEGRHLNAMTVAQRLRVNPAIGRYIVIACNTYAAIEAGKAFLTEGKLLEACKVYLAELEDLTKVWGPGPHEKGCKCGTCQIRAASLAPFHTPPAGREQRL